MTDRIVNEHDGATFMIIIEAGSADVPRFHGSRLVSRVARFLEQGRNDEETAWVRSLRVFIRALLAPRPGKRPNGGAQP
jgi:hypothetical protein